MKLSEAIRLGAMLHPQCFGGYYTTDGEGRVHATCALEAAARAGYRDDRTVLLRPAHCPACGLGWTEALRAVVAHLNDHHMWTREAIADWVATYETAEVPAVEAV